MNDKDILDLPMYKEFSGETIGSYFSKMMIKLWEEGESFSGKRPFGNSGWEHDVYESLVMNEVCKGAIDRYDDDPDWFDVEIEDYDEADKIISKALGSLYK